MKNAAWPKSVPIVGFICAAGLLFACSDPAPASPPPSGSPIPDGGQPRGDASINGPGEDGGATTGEACISACEAQYPSAAQRGQVIDTCIVENCDAPCNNADPDGQLHEPTTGSCNNVVRTPSASCSQCVVEKCCAAWDACFDGTDCKALNTCTDACTGK
jgi:hypothetical protein